MPRPRLHITEEALRRAYAARRTAAWPESFAAAMADPLVSRLVRAAAVQAALRATAAACHPGPRTPPAAHPNAVDLKRRAAGDVD